MKRIFAIGDIHGAAKALIQCLQRCNFNYEEDTLIMLGDVCDGWSEVYECVEELLKIKNLIPIMGNHDEWFLQFLRTGDHPPMWRMGGEGTRTSYLRQIGKEHLSYGSLTALLPEDVPDSHRYFFHNMLPFYILRNEKQHICFVHGGFDRDYSIDTQHIYTLMWDRDLWELAKCCKGNQKLKMIDDFTSVFIGHTHVDGIKNPECLPQTSGGITNLDTGAGWSGKLTIMDVNTKEFWQSDFVTNLYPDEKGRRG